MDTLQAWQAFINTLWVLYNPYWACPTETASTCLPKVIPKPTEGTPDAVASSVTYVEDIPPELMPLDIADDIQRFIVKAKPPIDIITFVNTIE